jgi:UDP-glucose 4-epimerase
MENSLVTGGAGFIGSHVAEQCIRLGHHVVVLDDLSGGFKDNIPDGAEFVKGSILDFELIDELFRKHKFTYLYHLAAYAAEGLSHFIKRFNYSNNLIGSINLINASVNYHVKCFIFTSSIAVYGENQSPMTEEMLPNPEDSYGIAKLACEQELKVSKKMFGLDYIIFRPHNVYGERQNIGDRYRNVVGIFMNQILKNDPMTIFGDGEQRRAFTYIGDVAPVIAQSPQTCGAINQTFNVGADTPYSVNELAAAIAKAMGAELRLQYLDARKEVQIAFSDHAKVEQVFKILRKTSLDTGIRRMAAWAIKHGARESKVFTDIEINKNMPASWLRAIKTEEARVQA